MLTAAAAPRPSATWSATRSTVAACRVIASAWTSKPGSVVIVRRGVPLLEAGHHRAGALRVGADGLRRYPRDPLRQPGFRRATRSASSRAAVARSETLSDHERTHSSAASVIG